MESDLELVGHMADGGTDGVSVHTGFPNPALDQRGRSRPLALDINSLLIKRPSSTYLFRVTGHQWSDQGIFDGDVAIIDRALRARTGDIVISWQDSGFIICRQQHLQPGEEALGVITATIHQYREEKGR